LPKPVATAGLARYRSDSAFRSQRRTVSGIGTFVSGGNQLPRWASTLARVGPTHRCILGRSLPRCSPCKDGTVGGPLWQAQVSWLERLNVRRAELGYPARSTTLTSTRCGSNWATTTPTHRAPRSVRPRGRMFGQLPAGGHCRNGPFTGKFPASCPAKRGVPLHLTTAAEHRFRESSQMAAHDSFARIRPTSAEARPRAKTASRGRGAGRRPRDPRNVLATLDNKSSPGMGILGLAVGTAWSCTRPGGGGDSHRQRHQDQPLRVGADAVTLSRDIRPGTL
jgi:hypothetical protein